WVVDAAAVDAALVGDAAGAILEDGRRRQLPAGPALLQQQFAAQADARGDVPPRLREQRHAFIGRAQVVVRRVVVAVAARVERPVPGGPRVPGELAESTVREQVAARTEGE